MKRPRAVKRPRASVVLGALAACALLAAAPATQAEPRRELLGRSAQGRPIELFRVGDPRARERILVVGCIHGNECAGVPVARRLLREEAPPNAALWVVPNLNPDGLAGRHRQNGRGVDLNRNFGAMWRPIGRRWDPQYAGPRPWSEPETRLIRALILRVRPTVTIWFHQPQDLVRAWGPSVPAGTPVRAPGRRALPRPPLAERNRPELAEPPLPAHRLVRRRAPFGLALARSRASPRLRDPPHAPLGSVRMLAAGDPIPQATVWTAPRESTPLRELLGGRAALVVFYLFDWSAT